MLQVEKKERFWEEEGFGEKDVFGIGSRTFVLLEKKKKIRTTCCLLMTNSYAYLVDWHTIAK